MFLLLESATQGVCSGFGGKHSNIHLQSEVVQSHMVILNVQAGWKLPFLFKR